LQLKRRPLWQYALLIGWLVAQLSWGLHYWPIPPIQGALMLAMATYLSNELLEAHLRGHLVLQRGIEILALGAITLALIITFS
jgi:hypothetical protein